MFGIPVDMDKSMQRLREYLGFPVGLELVLEEEEKNLLVPARRDSNTWGPVESQFDVLR